MYSSHLRSHLSVDINDDDDGDTASQRSISLSSPADSVLQSLARPTPISPPYSEFNFESDHDEHSLYTSELDVDTAATSAVPSEYSQKSAVDDTTVISPSPVTTYPPPSIGITDRDSVASFATTSSYSKKARPESTLLTLPKGPLVLGIALVDFNHIVGPKIEFSRGDIFEDEEITKILPFLALPDGAHLVCSFDQPLHSPANFLPRHPKIIRIFTLYHHHLIPVQYSVYRESPRLTNSNTVHSLADVIGKSLPQR